MEEAGAKGEAVHHVDGGPVFGERGGEFVAHSSAVLARLFDQLMETHLVQDPGDVVGRGRGDFPQKEGREVREKRGGICRPVSAKVFPLKKRKGAERCMWRRNPKVSASVISAGRRSSQRLAHAW